MKGSRAFQKALFAASGAIHPIQRWWRNRRWSGDGTVALLSFDVDYVRDEEALPAVLRSLDRAGAQASFACIGLRVERNPALYRSIRDAGHEIVNHSYRHPDNRELCPGVTWTDLTPEEQRDEVWRAQQAIAAAVGEAPTGFRLPHFGNLQSFGTLDFYGMLAAQGIRYSSSMLDFRLDGLPAVRVERADLVEIGITTCPSHPYTAMDSYHVERSPRCVYRLVHRARDLVESLGRALDDAVRRRALFNVYLDPADVAAGQLDRLLETIRALEVPMHTYAGYLASGPRIPVLGQSNM